MRETILLFFMINILSGIASAQNQCASLIGDPGTFPLCPENTSILPDNFPTQAVILNDIGSNERNDDFPVDIIEQIFTVNRMNSPRIVLAGSRVSLRKAHARIDSLNFSDEEKEELKSRIVRVGSNRSAWLQDFFQPVVNPQGQVQFRKVEGYSLFGAYRRTGPLISPLEECNVTSGEDIDTGGIPLLLKGGYFGGNMESLPGGTCMLGSDKLSESEWTSLANQVCPGSEEDRLKVPTDWLYVGHTDEVVKVIKNNNREAPCDFSVAVASPQKAIELLSANQNARFVEFRGRNGSIDTSMSNVRSNTNAGFQALCSEVAQLGPPNQNEIQRLNEGIGHLIEFLFPRANAQENLENQESYCSRLSNFDVLRVMRGNNRLGVSNRLIQKQMDELKVQLRNNLRSKFPNCTPDIIDVPNLFYGGFPVCRDLSSGQAYDDEKCELPQGSARSITPNTMNSISVGNAVIIPEPGNSAFRSYTEREINSRGVSARFVDSFDFAHAASGGIHCATQTIPTCRPRPQGSAP